MFLAEKKRRETTPFQALTGPATTPGGGAVWLEGERRGVRIYAPGGYHWLPRRGEEVLVLKAGEEGGEPCALGVDAAGEALEPGEVLLTAGTCRIKLNLDGTLELGGQVKVTGDLTVNGRQVAFQPGAGEGEG